MLKTETESRCHWNLSPHSEVRLGQRAREGYISSSGRTPLEWTYGEAESQHMQGGEEVKPISV